MNKMKPLKLDFNVFQRKINDDQLVGYYATIHCMTTMDRFVFVMKSREKIYYYTAMPFESIAAFAEKDNIDVMVAFDMFVTNYCSGTLPIEDEVEIEESTYEESSEYSEEITKLLSESQSKTISTTPINKNEIINAGADIIDEAKDYSGFLLQFFNRLEKGVLSAANKIDIEKSYTTKTFGEFLKQLFDIVNTIAFGKQVKKYIKMDLIAGMNSSETELDMDLGFTDGYEQKLNQLASQQIDGYTINGKKWPGIKGVTKEIQADVIRTVQEGLNDKQTLKEIKDSISTKFKMFSDWRSEMIARTESNRIVNEGKMLGYKESGLDGGKIVIVALDNRTTDICRRLHKTYANNPIPLDDDFIDPETMKAYRTPPFHVNCRSTIAFRPK